MYFSNLFSGVNIKTTKEQSKQIKKFFSLNKQEEIKMTKFTEFFKDYYKMFGMEKK